MFIALTVVVALGVVALFLILVARRLLRTSLPQTRGSINCAELTGETTLGRDRDGFVYVSATSLSDAAYAMGVAHAQDRLWQLELARRVAGGRLSEFAGPETLDADRFMRRIGLHRVAAQEARVISGEPLQMLEAYAAGVNSVIESGKKLPLEFRILKLTPEPWRVVDSLSCAKLLAMGLSTNWDHELQRLDLLRQIGPERAAQLEVVYPDANPTILAHTARAAGTPDRDSARRLYAEAARWIPAAGGGSNSWVVSGARTESGRPMLCNDPHLPPAVPAPWYRAHVRVIGDFATTGGTFPGLPFPIIGHNGNVAWGFTNSFADCQDLVIEDFEDASLRRYRTENGAQEARVVREIVRIKGASDHVEEVVLTRHGPVVERITAAGGTVWRGLALQWTALAPGGAAAAALLAIQRTRNGEEFRAAFSGFDAPAQNVVWADSGGNIGYFLCGKVPVRRREPSGLPVPGWTGDALWSRDLTAIEMPALSNPSGGRIVTANNRIVGDAYPHYIASDYMNGYRAQRIQELLDTPQPLTHQYMADMQADIISHPAREVARLVRDVRCSTKDSERVRQLLAAWDGDMSEGSTAATAYTLFLRYLTEAVLSPVCGEAWRTVAGMDRAHPVVGYPGNIIGRVTPALLERWSNDDTTLLGGVSWSELAAGVLERVARDSRRKQRWGTLHVMPLMHQMARGRAGSYLFKAMHVNVGGDSDCILATSYVPSDSGFETRLFAPSWRHIIDVGEWDNSTAIHYPGQSGQPSSRHYRDLIKRWHRNRQIPLAWTDAAVDARIRRTLVLVPGAAVRQAGQAA